MATDPNWLPSTIVQSSAALVAIVGGFLGSRVLDRTAQQARVREQLGHLDAEVVAAAKERAALLERRSTIRRSEFMRIAAPIFYTSRVRDASKLADRVPLLSVPHGERTTFAEELCAFDAKTRGAVRRAMEHRPASEMTPGPERDRLIGEVPPELEPVLVELVRALDPVGRAPAAVPSGPAPAEAELTIQLDDLARRTSDLQARRDTLVAELRIAMVPGRFGLFYTLVAVLVFGIAFPLGVMSRSWPTLSSSWRNAMSVLFLASLVLVLVNLHRIIRGVSEGAKDPSGPS